MVDKEICCECGRSVKPGSGNFVNRVPVGDDFETRIEGGRPYPCGIYVCGECDAKSSDSLPPSRLEDICPRILPLTNNYVLVEGTVNSELAEEICKGCNRQRKVYIVVVTIGYVPEVNRVYMEDPDDPEHSKKQALSYAKDYSSEWKNSETKRSGCIYFNQEESGNMDNSVSVIEAEIAE